MKDILFIFFMCHLVVTQNNFTDSPSSPSSPSKEENIIHMIKNIPFNNQINKGEVQMYDLVIKKESFNQTEKITVRAMVNALVSLKLYNVADCKGLYCEKYLTNDRLHYQTEKMTFYKEDIKEDITLKVELRSHQNTDYKMTVKVEEDYSPAVLTLMHDEVPLQDKLLDGQAHYYEFMTHELEYLEINVDSLPHYQSHCLSINVGVKSTAIPDFSISSNVLWKGNQQVIINKQDNHYQENKGLVIQVNNTCDASVDYQIELSTEKSLSFLRLNSERYQVMTGSSHKYFEVYLGNLTDDQMFIVSMKQAVLTNSTHPLHLTIHSSLLSTSKTFRLEDEQSLSFQQMKAICIDPTKCKVYLKVDNMLDKPVAIRIGIREGRMPVQLVTSQPVRLQVSSLLPKQTFFYLPQPHSPNDISLRIDSPPQHGMDIKFALIRNLEMAKLNYYLHNKIDDDFQQQLNQHVITLEMKQDTLEKCYPSCLFVLVVSPSNVSQPSSSNGYLNLLISQGPLHVQLDTTHKIQLDQYKPYTLFVDTQHLFQYQKSLILTYSTQYISPDIITHVINSNPDGSFDSDYNSTNNTTFYTDNKIIIKTNQFENVKRIQLKLMSKTNCTILLATSTYNFNRVYPKMIYNFDLQNTHESKFMYFNFLTTKDIKIKIVDSNDYDYKSMQVKVKKCDLYNDKECKNSKMEQSLTLDKNNSFFFKNYFNVGVFIEQFKYYQLEFLISDKKVNELKGTFYIDEAANSYDRVFVDHQTLHYLKNSQKKFLFKINQNFNDIYSVTLNIKSGHPQLIIVYEDFNKLTDHQIDNEFQQVNHNNQKIISTQINTYLAQKAIKSQKYSNFYQYSNIHDIEIPMIIKCSDACDFTLEINHDQKQILRFDQVYHGVLDEKEKYKPQYYQQQESDEKDKYSNMVLYRDSDNQNKNIYMFITFTDISKEYSFEDIDIQVEQFNRWESLSNDMQLNDHNEEETLVEVVFQTKHFMEIKLAKVKKQTYQVVFKNFEDMQVVFNIQNQVMLLPLYDTFIRSLDIENQQEHSYLLGNPFQDGELMLNITKCKGDLQFTLERGGDIDDLQSFNLTIGAISSSITTREYQKSPVILTVHNRSPLKAMYKVSLDFLPNNRISLIKAITPNDLSLNVTVQNGQVQVSVQTIKDCYQTGCDDYYMKDMEVEYHFILSTDQQYMNPVGQCRLEMHELAQLSSNMAVFDSNEQMNEHYVVDKKITLTGIPKQDRVSVKFKEVTQKSLLMVTASISQVKQRGQDGIQRGMHNMSLPYHLTQHIPSKQNNVFTLADYGYYYLHYIYSHFLFIFIAIIILILVLNRKAERKNARAQEQLQMQIHQIRADEYTMDEKNQIKTDNNQETGYQQI